MNRRAVWAIALCVLLLGAAAAGLRMMFPDHFDAVRWRAADSPSTFLRRREMLPDIDRMFADKTIDSKQLALQQLGRPQTGDPQADNVWLYDLGLKPATTAPAHQWLELRFDDNDRL